MDRRAFIKTMNRALAGAITMLGFVGCEKESGAGGITPEYGTPHADYTVKGAVTHKATGKPIAGIRVGYNSGYHYMYGPPPANFVWKSHVMTNAKGEFVLTDHFRDEEFQMVDNKRILPVYVEDVDGEENGWYQSESLQVEFPRGIHTVSVDVELTEITNQ